MKRSITANPELAMALLFLSAAISAQGKKGPAFLRKPVYPKQKSANQSPAQRISARTGFNR